MRVLTYANHDGGVGRVRLVLRGVALDPEVSPKVTLPDLVELVARKCLENLKQKGDRAGVNLYECVIAWAIADLSKVGTQR